MEQSKTDYYRQAAVNLLILEETKALLSAFNKEKIKTIPLKGVFLMENVYKNIALRPVTDADILIRKIELSQVNKILNSLGYSTPANYQSALKNSFPLAVNSLVYRSEPARLFVVHLHWHLINTTWPLDSLVKKMEIESIWARAEPIKINGVQTLTLAPEHQLIYLCQHAFTHVFDKQILSVDIIEIIKHYKDRIDWGLIKQESKRYGLDYIVYHALFFASQALSFEIPYLEELKPKRFGLFEKSAFSFMRRGRHNYALSCLVYFGIQKGLLKKLRFIGRMIWPSTYVMADNCALPLSRITPIHYFRRLINRLPAYFRFFS